MYYLFHRILIILLLPLLASVVGFQFGPIPSMVIEQDMQMGRQGSSYAYEALVLQEPEGTTTPDGKEICHECEIAGDRIEVLTTQAAIDRAEGMENQRASVQALLLWMEGCPACHEVLENTLPPLKAQYGDALEILLVELKSQEDVDALFALGESLGLPKERIGVPFLIIGDQVLIGSMDIPARLPSLVENYLKSGGISLPQIAGLETFLQGDRAQPFVTDAPRSEQADNAAIRPQGFGLAISTLMVMILALVYGIWALWRGQRRQWAWFLPDGWTKVIPLLALLGIAISSYLAYVETQAVVAICGPVGDCNSVQHSVYAQTFGISNGLLGLIGYLLMLAAWRVGTTHRGKKSGLLADVLLLMLALLSLLFSIYLTYLEPFVIKAVCLWCLSSALVVTGIFLLSLRPGSMAYTRWIKH